MRFGGAMRPHLVESNLAAETGGLEGGLRTGKATADYANVFGRHSGQRSESAQRALPVTRMMRQSLLICAPIS